MSLSHQVLSVISTFTMTWTKHGQNPICRLRNVKNPDLLHGRPRTRQHWEPNIAMMCAQSHANLQTVAITPTSDSADMVRYVRLQYFLDRHGDIV